MQKRKIKKRKEQVGWTDISNGNRSEGRGGAECRDEDVPFQSPVHVEHVKR